MKTIQKILCFFGFHKMDFDGSVFPKYGKCRYCNYSWRLRPNPLPPPLTQEQKERERISKQKMVSDSNKMIEEIINKLKKDIQ